MSSTSAMIAESVNRMLSDRVDRQLLGDAESGRWPNELWNLIEDSGFCSLLCAGADDGEGPWQNAYPVFHAIGFHRLPLPLAESVVGNALADLVGLTLPHGPVAVIQQASGLELSLEGGQLVVSGAAASVPWARAAGGILVAGRAGGEQVLGLVEPAARGVGISAAASIAAEPRDAVLFDRVRCTRYADAQALPEAPVTLFCALARAAQMVGAGQSVLQQSIAYANERVQFGKPIAKYQAIQQALAVLAGEVACAQTATLAACRSPAVVPREFDVAVAKVRAGQMAGVAANIGHEVHGAFGFTYEHTLHFATRRLWCWRAEYGSESFWAARLGRPAVARGGDAFWGNLVAGQA